MQFPLLYGVLPSLVSGVIAGHVAFAAVDAHLGVDQGHHVLAVVQVVVRAWNSEEKERKAC